MTDKMDYEYEWIELKTWLINSIMALGQREMELRVQGDNSDEHIRVKAKLDGLMNCLQHIRETEKIHEDY